MEEYHQQKLKELEDENKKQAEKNKAKEQQQAEQEKTSQVSENVDPLSVANYSE